MVMNFIHGGAAINVFCKQHGITLNVVDAGVNYDFPKNVKDLIHSKIERGTKNFAKEPAMSIKQAQRCIDTGANLVKNIYAKGCNIIGFGEMGIGNTSSASAIMSLICKIPVQLCVGSGTGLDEHAVKHKIKVLIQALKKYDNLNTPLKVLAALGGFEIAQMAGGMLQAAECGMIILVDGFIATAAYLVAQAIEPVIKDYSFFCHQSQEKGHKLLLQHLGVSPLLNLGMRLGEGTGAAVAYPIIKSAVAFLNEMASFESAGVSEKAV
jgi:nicotinate-nucleotide--dimethylbenzimidazole phosphoribosyltransferase